jgi:hypothetical protein
MTDKRSATGPLAKVEPEGGESLARLSDHLGRLLVHADKLLAEWQAHAEGAARGAGDALSRTLEAALADASQMAAIQLERALGANAARLAADLERARQAAADLEGHMARIAGGAKPTSIDELRAQLGTITNQLRALRRGGRPWTLILAATANLLVLGLLALVWQRTSAPTPAPPPAPAPVVVVTPDAPPPPPPRPRAPCSALAPEPAAKLAQACLTQLCAATAPKACRPEDPAARDLVAAFAAVEREKSLSKLACTPPAPDADGRVAVTVRWLLDCPSAR